MGTRDTKLKWTTKEIFNQLKAGTVSLEYLNEIRKDNRKSVQTALTAYLKREEKQKMEILKYDEMTRFEKEIWAKGFEKIAGVDEVGRGPLAGPVVSAAVILPKAYKILGLNDSKQLSDKKRSQLYEEIQKYAVAIGIGIASVEEIDMFNIYHATKLAMQRAIDDLPVSCDYLCIDAMELDVNIPQLSVIKGDARSVSIAAASIIAKQTRDQMMRDYAKQFPGYGFEKNAGYGTRMHLEALHQFGVTPIHRKSFAPVKNLL